MFGSVSLTPIAASEKEPQNYPEHMTLNRWFEQYDAWCGLEDA